MNVPSFIWISLFHILFISPLLIWTGLKVQKMDVFPSWFLWFLFTYFAIVFMFFMYKVFKGFPSFKESINSRWIYWFHVLILSLFIFITIYKMMNKEEYTPITGFVYICGGLLAGSYHLLKMYRFLANF